MTRTKMNVPRHQASNQNKSKKHEHRFSVALDSDARLRVPPRFVQSLFEDEAYLYTLKIYAALEAPGSELMSLARVEKQTSNEYEIRFDERFAVSLQFKKQTDDQRFALAKDQIARVGGLKALSNVFSQIAQKSE